MGLEQRITGIGLDLVLVLDMDLDPDLNLNPDMDWDLDLNLDLVLELDIDLDLDPDPNLNLDLDLDLDLNLNLVLELFLALNLDLFLNLDVDPDQNLDLSVDLDLLLDLDMESRPGPGPGAASCGIQWIPAPGRMDPWDQRCPGGSCTASVPFPALGSRASIPRFPLKAETAGAVFLRVGIPMEFLPKTMELTMGKISDVGKNIPEKSQSRDLLEGSSSNPSPQKAPFGNGVANSCSSLAGRPWNLGIAAWISRSWIGNDIFPSRMDIPESRRADPSSDPSGFGMSQGMGREVTGSFPLAWGYFRIGFWGIVFGECFPHLGGRGGRAGRALPPSLPCLGLPWVPAGLEHNGRAGITSRIPGISKNCFP